MEAILIKAAQLVTALALLVIVHEFGHYIIARAFGIKVEKFYLFFNPWFSLYKWKPKKTKKTFDKNGNEKATWRDTEYGIGWLPLGGYVKIAGMIDESMDKEQMAQPEKPWEFRAKPTYQRLAVMVAGVVFNFILAILIYAGIAWHWGSLEIPYETAYEGMNFVDAAKEAGFKDGDVILSADGEKIDVSKPYSTYRIANAKYVTVLRNHTDTTIVALPRNFLESLGKDEGFMEFRMPVVVKKVSGGSEAMHAGLFPGDKVLKVADKPASTYMEMSALLKENANKKTSMQVQRGKEIVDLTITPSEDGKLGFELTPITEIYPTTKVQYGFFQSFPKGWQIGTTTLTTYVGSLKVLFTKSGAQNIGGFGAIGSMFPDRWDWYSFWSITAFLSVVLAFMNIIPIPGLDGGHVLFLLWEIVTRRKPSDKFMEYAQIAGMAFLILLLVYANGQDIIRALAK